MPSPRRQRRHFEPVTASLVWESVSPKKENGLPRRFAPRNDSAALPRCRDVGDAVPYKNILPLIAQKKNRLGRFFFMRGI